MRVALAFLISPMLSLVFLYVLISAGVLIEVGGGDAEILYSLLVSSVFLLLPVYVVVVLISIPVFLVVRSMAGWSLAMCIFSAILVVALHSAIIALVSYFVDMDVEELQSGKFLLGVAFSSIVYGSAFYFISGKGYKESVTTDSHSH